MSGNHNVLHHFVARIHELHREREIIMRDIAKVYREARNLGLDKAVLREVVREAQAEPSKRHERYQRLDEYRNQLGLFADGGEVYASTQPSEPIGLRATEDDFAA